MLRRLAAGCRAADNRRQPPSTVRAAWTSDLPTAGAEEEMTKLSPAVRAFLEEPRFCVFADIGADGRPHQTVLWYELQGDTIMMNTACGRAKDRNLRRDPRASFCVEGGARYVAIRGTCTLQADDQEAAQADIKRLAARYDGAESAERQAATFRKQRRETIRMTIERVDAHGFDE
jgi:PPOX class probable F420-dependent enzyme